MLSIAGALTLAGALSLHAPGVQAAGNTGDNTTSSHSTGSGPQGAGNNPANDKASFSHANHLLFMSNQLGGIKPPKLLKYKYSVSGTSDNFSDAINLSLHAGKHTGKTVHVDFLTGKRHRYVPEITGAHGNPITEIFLQHDVWTLGKNTGGDWHYFQKRIKLALQNDATIQKQTIQYQGQPIHVTRITVTPYSDMQKHQKDMGQSLGRRYVFTLSHDVPGGVLKITSTAPAAKGTPAKVRQVAFSSIQPLAGSDHNSSPTARQSNAAATIANTTPQTILVLPFDLVDTNVEAGTTQHPLASDITRLHQVDKVADHAINKLPNFQVIPDRKARPAINDAKNTYRYLYECNGCDVDIGKQAGADLVMTGWVQKVSNLILNVNATIRDVSSGKVVAEAGVSMRGDTDQSWFDSTRYMIKHPLLTNYHAVRAAHHETPQSEG